MADLLNPQRSIEPATVSVRAASLAANVGMHAKPGRNLGGALRSGERIFQPLPTWVWVMAVVLAALSAASPNPVLTPFAILMLPLLASLLWFRGEPPVLLFACAMQWVQAATAIFYTDFYGIALSEELRFGGPELVKATWLSLVGVLMLAVGIRLALMKRRGDVLTQAARESELLRPDRIFVLYLISFVVFTFGSGVAFSIPQLTQPLLATARLQWVLVFLLAYAVLKQRRRFALLAIVVCLECVAGLMVYFAGFKSIFFILLVVLPGVRNIFKGWRLLQIGTVIIVMITLGVIWTAIKTDYRQFLNQGTGQQVVLVPVDERLDKLVELVVRLDVARLEDGLEDSVLRMSYVKFFAFTITNVPARVPYANGALWWGTIEHVFTPRFLFPDKPGISDSERTNKYSGVQVAGVERGTSIGIGYMGESYIDFGPFWMFAPILVLGLFYGFIYRFFVHHYPIKVLGFAMATSILLFGAAAIETSNIKLVGGNLMGLLVMGLFAKFIGPSFWKLITIRGTVLSRRRQKRIGEFASWPVERPMSREGRAAKI